MGTSLKRGRRLKRRQKVLLKEQGYDWKGYLYLRATAETLYFRQRNTNSILSIRR